MKLSKLTPILYVDAIEPSLPFWRDQLGFEIQTTVPHEDRIGYVIMLRDGIEVMMQTHASVVADVPSLGSIPRGASILFIEVSSIDEVLAALQKPTVVVP